MESNSSEHILSKDFTLASTNMQSLKQDKQGAAAMNASSKQAENDQRATTRGPSPTTVILNEREHANSNDKLESDHQAHACLQESIKRNDHYHYRCERCILRNKQACEIDKWQPCQFQTNGELLTHKRNMHNAFLITDAQRFSDDIPKHPPFTAFIGHLWKGLQTAEQFATQIEHLVDTRYKEISIHRGGECFFAEDMKVKVTRAFLGFDCDTGERRAFGFVEFDTLMEVSHDEGITGRTLLHLSYSHSLSMHLHYFCTMLRSAQVASQSR